jgi:hypothetical protein
LDDAAAARLLEGEILLLRLERAAQGERALWQVRSPPEAAAKAAGLLLALFRDEERKEDAREYVWEIYDRLDDADRPQLLARWFLIQFAEHPGREAAARLMRFAANDPKDWDANVAVTALTRNESPRTACDRLEAYGIPPVHRNARALLCDLRLELGEKSAAVLLLDEWPEDRRDARYWRLRALASADDAQTVAASIDALKTYLNIEPADWKMRNVLEAGLRRLGRTQEALDAQKENDRITKTVAYSEVQFIISNVIGRLQEPANRSRMALFYESLGMRREAQAWQRAAGSFADAAKS